MSWSNFTIRHGKQQDQHGERVELQRVSSHDSITTHSLHQDSNIPRDPSRESFTRLNESDGLGIPKRKVLTDKLDILALCIAWVCFVAARTVIAIFSVAYKVSYNSQLIVIGLLLSVQFLCFRRIAPTVFAQIEERIGASCLQSSDAILLNSPTIGGSGIGWRIVILFLTLLPLYCRSLTSDTLAASRLRRGLPLTSIGVASHWLANTTA